MVDGLRLVWDVKVLRTLALIDLAMTGLYLPMESVLFPKYFTERNEPTHDSRIAQGGPIVDGNEGMSSRIATTTGWSAVSKPSANSPKAIVGKYNWASGERLRKRCAAPS